MRSAHLILLFSTFLISFSTVHSQTDPPADASLNPYQTIYNHLYYLQDESYDPLLSGQSFNSPADSIENSKQAIKLKQVMDGMGLFVRLELIPNDPNFFDSTQNQPIYFPFADELPEVYVFKNDSGWHYSDETKKAISSLHQKVYPLGANILLNILPENANNKFFGLYLWQYLGFVLIGILVIILFYILRLLLSWIIRRLTSDYVLWKRMKFFTSVWGSLLFLQLLIPLLLLPPKLMEIFTLSLKIILSFVFLLILLQLINILITFLRGITEKTESKMDEQLLPVLKRGIQVIVLALWLLQILSLLGINVTALIAGISIGGLALALAAQDTLKNLFGSLTIFMDKPFQIGDWVQSGDAEGTVEEVGFRSTRIRSFENSLIYVPNSQLSDRTINNYGLRDFRRFKTTIGIRYDTPPDKVEEFIKGMRSIVSNHPHTKKDAFEIHLNNLGASALEILFYIFFETSTWTEELESKHEIIMSIIRLAEELGVEFAFPSTTVYLEK